MTFVTDRVSNIKIMKPSQDIWLEIYFHYKVFWKTTQGPLGAQPKFHCLNGQDIIDDDVTFDVHGIDQIGGHAVLELFQVDAIDEDVEMIRLAAHDQHELAAWWERIPEAVDTLALFAPSAVMRVQHDDPVSTLEARIDVQGCHLTAVRVSALLQVDWKPALIITKISLFNHNLI